MPVLLFSRSNKGMVTGVTIKAIVFKECEVYSKKVNSTRGQRNVHPKFTNDKILHFIISIIFSINKNDIVYLKAMKHYLFYF